MENKIDFVIKKLQDVFLPEEQGSQEQGLASPEDIYQQLASEENKVTRPFTELVQKSNMLDNRKQEKYSNQLLHQERPKFDIEKELLKDQVSQLKRANQLLRDQLQEGKEITEKYIQRNKRLTDIIYTTEKQYYDLATLFLDDKKEKEEDKATQTPSSFASTLNKRSQSCDRNITK